MNLSPIPVVMFGGGGTFPIPILIDANGVVQVSPPRDSTGHIATILDNTSGSMPFGDKGLVTCSIMFAGNNAGTEYFAVSTSPNDSDAIAPFADGQIDVNSTEYGFDGTNFDRIRLANVYKSVAATAAGNTAVWTPAAGKKFRLMAYTISVAGTLAATGVELIKLTDGAAGTVISQHNATVTITTPTGDTQIGADLGQGYLSGAINTALEVNLGTAMATGSVIVNAWGTEE